MGEHSERSVLVTRTALGRYQATNTRGGVIDFGTGEDADDDFTPVELLLVALAGCSAADVDFITVKRAEPTSFTVSARGDKIRDEQGNRLVDLRLVFDVRFADDEAGEAARAVLPRALAQSHDRLCTVSRTVELGTAVSAELA
ncbi:MAG: OsmC family protein [Sciscionella sp.]|nr:OsmC family protein [Sciscionella sp.]